MGLYRFAYLKHVHYLIILSPSLVRILCWVAVIRRVSWIMQYSIKS